MAEGTVEAREALGLLAGLDTPSSGSVQVDGQAVVGFPTPSRKLEFYSPTLRDWHWPEYAVPAYIKSHIHPANLDRAREEKVDVIGLSGLITPSLEEMSHVAREMKRQGFDIPLMIGGATTSRAHTALKIDPHYEAPVVWVKDASRAVGVVGALMSPAQQTDFAERNRRDQDQVRRAHPALREYRSVRFFDEYPVLTIGD